MSGRKKDPEGGTGEDEWMKRGGRSNGEECGGQVKGCNEGLWKGNRRKEREKVERKWLERKKGGKGQVRNR